MSLLQMDAAEESYSQLQKSKIEVGNLKALFYISGLQVEERQLETTDENNTQLNVELKLRVRNSFIAVTFQIPHDYPKKLPSFQLGESYMVKGTTISQLLNLLSKLPGAQCDD